MEAVRRAAVLALGLALVACSSDDADGAGDGGTGADATGTDAAGAGACQRQVLTGDVVNARAVGGLPLAGGKRLACGKLYRGGDLCGLDAAGCDGFAKLGIRAVVDLRAQAAQQSSPAPSCVGKVATLVPAPLPKLLPDTPANYLALLDETAAVKALFTALGQAGSYPVYIHCVIGRDRASVAVALVLLAAGAGRQAVIDEFNLSVKAGVAVKQPCIEALIDEVDRRGGIETYLQGAGVTAARLKTLRAQLVTD